MFMSCHMTSFSVALINEMFVGFNKINIVNVLFYNFHCFQNNLTFGQPLEDLPTSKSRNLLIHKQNTLGPFRHISMVLKRPTIRIRYSII